MKVKVPEKKVVGHHYVGTEEATKNTTRKVCYQEKNVRYTSIVKTPILIWMQHVKSKQCVICKIYKDAMYMLICFLGPYKHYKGQEEEPSEHRQPGAYSLLQSWERIGKSVNQSV